MTGAPPNHMRAIAEAAAQFRHDPFGYVCWAYPWGTGELDAWQGPDAWQRTTLEALGQRLQNPDGEPIRLSVGAANGSGKSALLSWLIDWAMSTSAHTRGTVTANTATQLRTKTWAELAKWRRLSLTEPLFSLQATSVTQAGHGQTWRIDAVPWSVERPEATAGMHNKGRRVLLLTDEASGVPDIIWEYQDASTTDSDTEIIWAVFGNTTRNSGRFRDCWGKFERRWLRPDGPGIHNGRVDGRECRTTNKRLIAQWAEDYGEDSDFFRVRVKAEFPRVGDLQFFPSDWVTAARARDIDNDTLAHTPATLAVDVATSGIAATVIACRRGPKLMWQKRLEYTPDTMALVGKLLDLIKVERNVRCICVDANGVGKGVADRLSELANSPGMQLPTIIHVYGAQQAGDPVQFRNLRSELFAKCREWLRGGEIPDDTRLIEQMEAIQAGYNNAMQLEVETKAKMVERLGYSPDEVDSLIYSFAEHIHVPTVQQRVQKREIRREVWR